MKREILFRGKRIDNGEWVYGNLFIFGSGYEIIPRVGVGLVKSRNVDPETVGQFMGLTDKKGNKIFEGDILQKWEVDWETDERNNFEGEEPLIATKKDVATMDRFPVFWLQNESFGYEGDDLEDSDKWEIIGNISDNPELLK